jgi:hypothetical protein
MTADMSGTKGSPYFCSQITEDAANAVPLDAGIPRTGGRRSDLPFEAVVQEYLQFPYEYFLSVLPFGVPVANSVLQITLEEEISGIKIG